MKASHVRFNMESFLRIRGLDLIVRLQFCCAHRREGCTLPTHHKVRIWLARERLHVHGDFVHWGVLVFA